ncbi:MAG: GNAT family N-acetyltransferase [Sedimenticola sp.]
MDAPLDDLEFEFSLRPDTDPSLSRYVIGFRGKALLWDDREATEKVVAELRGYRLDIASASMDGLEQNLLLDSVCPEISEFSETVFEASGCHYLHRLADGSTRNQEYDGLVWINEMQVDPDYRGQGIGTALLERVGQMIDLENCIIGLKAYPMAEVLGSKAEKAVVRRVKRFYERLGFVAAGGHFMVKESSLFETMKKRLAWRRDHETGYTIEVGTPLN